MRFWRGKDATKGMLLIDDYAAHLGVSRDTVYRNIREGTIASASKRVGRNTYIDQVKADALLAAPQAHKLQLFVARCKLWCKKHWLIITLITLLFLSWTAAGTILPMYYHEFVRRGLAEEALATENEMLRQGIDDLIGMSDKYTDLMDIGDALGMDIDEAIKELQDKNPNVSIPELTLFLLLEQAEFFATWIEQEIEQDREMLAGYVEQTEYTPNIWPTRGRIISGFGMRYALRGSSLARVRGAWGWHWHSGVDITGSTGQTVYATAKGEVIFAGWQSSYGNLVIIDHGGHYQTYYAHLSRIRVKVGDKVERGHNIGAVGDTGATTGSHLHYEVRIDGTPVDPKRFLP